MQNESVQQEFLSRFFHGLSENSVQYCVWGNYESLPRSLGGSDLDLLVRAGSDKKFKQVLKACVESFGGSFISFYKTNNASHFRVAGLHDELPWGIMIDVIYDQFYYKDKVYLPEKWAWHFLSDHNGITVNELQFSYIAGFLKELLHNGKVKDKYFYNAIAVITDSDKYKAFLIDVYGKQFFELMRTEFSKDPSRIDLVRLRRVLKRSIGSCRYKVLVNDFRNIRRLFLPAPGYVIAVLGTDGSGKSTIIENITPPLSDAFHKAVYYEHMRPNRFPSIARLFGGDDSFGDGPVTNPHGSSTSGFFGSLLRWAYYMLDYTIGFFLKIYPKKTIRSCVWIFDRYYYDYLIDPRRARIKLPRWVLKTGQFLIPEPDIILCLGADAHAIHQRKPELSLAEVGRQGNELKKFCASSKRAVWIDTAKSVEESSHDALRAILGMMSKRFDHVKLK